MRTEDEFKAWREFFEPMANEPALRRTIEIGRNEIKARLKLIVTDKEAVFQAIKNGQGDRT